ncbi:MAG: type IV toxin-antitoxin system AbiEi family antitoxin domain-containing protein [Nitrospinota bacterium]
MKQLSKESFQRLYEIAEMQQGFFTTKQAIAAGYADKTHYYNVHAGNWIREYRGIYRLSNFPHSEESDLVIWSLWSRNKQDIPQGIYSHETALSIHDLSDLMSSKLHMIVPPRFRRNSEIPEILVLHRAQLQESDIEARQGFQVTTPLRTITDLMVEQTVTPDIITQALREAVEKGLITRGAIKQVKSQTIQLQLEAIFQEVSL